MGERFLSVTTKLKRAKLQEAWNQSVASGQPLRVVIQSYIATASGELEGGGVQNSASAGHSAGAFSPGANQATGQEFVEMWQTLVDLLGDTKVFLVKCATYGLDAFTIECRGAFPSPLPDPVENPVTIDTNGRWVELATRYNCENGEQFPLINAPVSDENDTAIFLWMMRSLVPITRGGNDFSYLRTAGAGGFA